MAVLGRVLLSSGERVDLADFLSIDSYTAGDLQNLLTGFVGSSTPYILKGFDVIAPQSAVGTQSCSINAASAAVFYPGSSAGPFYFGLPTTAPLVPELRQNAVNYIYLTLTTNAASADTRAFWDPDANGGTGDEFTQEVNTESVLTAQVGVSVGSFPTGSVPLAIVTMGSVVITAIEDARPLMYRLGSGGIAPNPYNTFAWPSLPNTSYERQEPPNTIVSGGVNPFQGADKNITTLKQWMDAVMTKLLELGGTTFWYEDASTYSLISLFTDALATTFKTKGQYAHDSATPGLLTWTEDIQYKITSDPRTYILRNGNITLANEQVAYLGLVRDGMFNNVDQVVAWTNGTNYVNTVGGAIGLFANLQQGDYVKRPNDPDNYFLRVEQFYDTVNLSGSPTTAANAKSILLSGNYQGSTINDVGRRDKGVYLSSDVVISNRNSASIDALGGNFSWLAIRSDTIEGISNIVSTSLTISAITTPISGSSTVTTTAAHGLNNDDYIHISGTTNYNGTYSVTVDSSTQFSIQVSGTPAAETSGTATYAIVTTSAYTNGYGLVLESADNGFSTGDTVTIAGTVNYNGNVLVSTRNSTTFQMAVSSGFATETAGTATLARIIIRAENGPVSITQGEAIGSDGVISNIKLFLGMTSDSQLYPEYSTSSSYNTLFGQYNFNGASTDNVTVRLSNLTSMMADRAQDKTIKYLTEATSAINTQVGSAQELTFVPGGNTLTILQPGSAGNAVITLPSTAPGISLLAEQSAYVTLNRNALADYPVTWTVANNSAIPIGENIIVIATRLTDNTVYLWDNLAVVGAAPINGAGTGIVQFDLYDPLDTTLPISGAGSYTQLNNSQTPTNIGIMDGAAILGYSFVASASGNITQVQASLRVILGSPNCTIQANLYSDAGGVPGTLISSSTNTISSTSLTGSYSVETFNFSAGPLTNTTQYWIVFTTPTVVTLDPSNGFGIAEISGVSTSAAQAPSPYTSWTPTAGYSFIGTVTSSGGAGTITIDGVTLNAGQQVLFSNLASGNNQIYQAVGSGTNITSWVVQYVFDGLPNPTVADLAIARYGNAFANQTGEFNGTTWQFNNVVRYFGLGNDVTNWWEQTGLMTTTLSDNTTNGTVFSIAHVGSENIIVDYSLVRGVSPEYKETGSLYITTDGTSVSVVEGGANLHGQSGVTFSGVISGSNLVLQYTTTSTGSSATMKYSTKIWSDSAGGPSGPPSYSASSASGVLSLNGESGVLNLVPGANITISPSGSNITIAATSTSTPPGGANTAIQFNSGGTFAGDSRFEINTASGALNLNGLSQSVLNGPLNILDNQASPVTVFSYSGAPATFAIIEYSIVKNGSFRVGRLLIANNGTSVSTESDDYVETGTSGVVFSANFSSGNVNVQYTSTNTGAAGVFKYSMRSWS